MIQVLVEETRPSLIPCIGNDDAHGGHGKRLAARACRRAFVPLIFPQDWRAFRSSEMILLCVRPLPRGNKKLFLRQPLFAVTWKRGRGGVPHAPKELSPPPAQRHTKKLGHAFSTPPVSSARTQVALGAGLVATWPVSSPSSRVLALGRRFG